MRTWEKVPLTPRQQLSYSALYTHGVKPASDPGELWHYLAFDPGKVTGFAAFASNGAPTVMGHIPDWNKGVFEFLKQFARPNTKAPKVVIYEAYQIRGRGQRVDENAILTRAVIAVIKNFAALVEAELVAQQAAVLPIAAKFSGMEMPRDHSLSHQISAFNHGWYRLTEDKVVIPRILWPEG